MGWTIGKRRVEVKVNGHLLSVIIDDEKPKPVANARLLGDFPIQIGKRTARIRRVRNLDVARSELWIDETCVPKSLDSLVQKLAPKNAFCSDKHPESFRTAAAPAKYMCGVCRTLLCTKCVAVDRVRCAQCFEAASRADALALKQLRMKGLLIGAAIGLFFVLMGFAIGEVRLVQLGSGSIILLIFLVVRGLSRERHEASKLASRRAEP